MLFYCHTSTGADTVTRYQVRDTQTGANVGKPYTNRNAARRRVDTLDNAYGAYRYTVVTVEPSDTPTAIEAIASELVAELAPPGSFTARNFAQINLAETLLHRCRAYFVRVAPATPELAAMEVIAPIYARRFPST